eukprot:scaffold23_cov268-Pinguiococcus_pyrenoidosus.AAC.5
MLGSAQKPQAPSDRDWHPSLSFDPHDWRDEQDGEGEGKVTDHDRRRQRDRLAVQSFSGSTSHQAS